MRGFVTGLGGWCGNRTVTPPSEPLSIQILKGSPTMRRLIMLLLSCASLSCASLFCADSVCRVCASEVHWPGLLGPQRDGWVGYFQAPTEWPAELRQVWQAEVGSGYGSPLVADGRVFQHARQQDDEVVWCLDLDSGDVIWRQQERVPFEMGGGAEKHGKGPKSSPVYADGRLFTMSIVGQLSAWDADSGQRLWRRNYDFAFGGSRPYWGAAMSPIVDDGRVVVHFGTDDAGALVALSAETGDEIWRQGNDGASYSSPLVVELQGVRQVIDWNHRALVGVDLQSGRQLWEYEFPHEGTNQNMPTPVAHDDRILLGGENRELHSLEPRLLNGDWTVEKVWSQNDVALDMSTAVMNGDLLFGFSHYGKGRLFCVDAESGRVLWQGPGRTGENVAFLSVPGHVAALINDGEFRIIAATAGQLETVVSWQLTTKQAWAPPVLLNDGILLKDDSTLTRWSFGK